jgi:SAM-dependent methyltransferase
MKNPDRRIHIQEYNRFAWDTQVAQGNKFTVPVDAPTIARARGGNFSVFLTETKPVPRPWFPETLKDMRILGLACGGGQQGPIFAALGARVTILDNSPAQLEHDRQVADREHLAIRTVEGDMRNLTVFPDESFDLVFHPVANVFCPEVRAVWSEAARVLRLGGLLLAGLANPLYYLFGTHLEEQERLTIRYSIPYSDLDSLSDQELQECLDDGTPLEFGHSLTDLIGGQTEAGFAITGFYEDVCPDSPISKYHPTYIATRAIKITDLP